MTLRLEKIAETKDSTVSRLLINGVYFCIVIEDGDRNPKVMHETRIPAGCYKLTKRQSGRHYNAYSVRFKHDFTVMLNDVPNFSWIMIHIGNTIKHTSGCLLLNSGFTVDENGNFKGISSTKIYKQFYKIMKKADFTDLHIEITR